MTSPLKRGLIDDCEDDVLSDLGAKRKRLNRQIATTLENALGGAAELRLMIYEYLCHEDDGIHIPNLDHEFFHVHDTGDVVSLVFFEEDYWPPQLCLVEKEEIVKERLAALRAVFIFDPKLCGSQMALEITETFFKTNVFHLRDARHMSEFINTPFPCGSIPRDHVRNIVVYVRFEDFLEEAGWSVRTYDEEPQVPPPDFVWREHGVYNKFRRDIAFIQNTSFAKSPKVTLVMVTPFSRWDAKDLDEERITLNFLEVILPTYRHLKNNGSETKVISQEIDSLNEECWYHREEEDVTWQVEIAAKIYAQAPVANYAYPGGEEKTPQRIRLEEHVKEAAPQRAG
ncbi:uncharacterized protein J4E79_002172 [Alternaria viburni]|uniref:uncharacterized protein n=1 Tax=Alternaria viburni TaxID=566460 RepID=UPI0020C59EC2|nr:uncharacterized protein J4E79_002172 [Alternaria viburni]KAI4667484.1 hypothetical protein J4E79_002172 [Alternaria viburni]